MSRKFISRSIMFAYLALVTYAISWSIRLVSISGIILSLLSLAAGIHFLYLLNRLHKEAGSESDV